MNRTENVYRSTAPTPAPDYTPLLQNIIDNTDDIEAKQDTMIGQNTTIISHIDDIEAKQDTMIGQNTTIISHVDDIEAKQDTIIGQNTTIISHIDDIEAKQDTIIGQNTTIISHVDDIEPLLTEIENHNLTIRTSNDAIVVNTQDIEDKLDLLKPAFEIGIELVDGGNGSNIGIDYTYTIPQAIHQMSIIDEVKIGTATSKGSITSNYVLTAGVLQVFSVGTMNGEYIWITGTKI